MMPEGGLGEGDASRPWRPASCGSGRGRLSGERCCDAHCPQSDAKASDRRSKAKHPAKSAGGDARR
jgi:hypothetical protein